MTVIIFAVLVSVSYQPYITGLTDYDGAKGTILPSGMTSILGIRAAITFCDST